MGVTRSEKRSVIYLRTDIPNDIVCSLSLTRHEPEHTFGDQEECFYAIEEVLGWKARVCAERATIVVQGADTCVATQPLNTIDEPEHEDMLSDVEVYQTSAV